MALNENKNIISVDKKAAETFHSLFSNVVKTLNIYQTHIYGQINDYFYSFFLNCKVDFEEDLMRNTAY